MLYRDVKSPCKARSSGKSAAGLQFCVSADVRLPLSVIDAVLKMFLKLNMAEQVAQKSEPVGQQLQDAEFNRGLTRGVWLDTSRAAQQSYSCNLARLNSLFQPALSEGVAVLPLASGTRL